MSYRVVPIPALNDNYVWCLYDTERKTALVVDPGEAEPVENFLAEQGLALDTVLVTHHHPDHTNGIRSLEAQYSFPVYGPADSPCKAITHPLNENDQLQWHDVEFSVLAVPGHTLDHIAFNSDSPALDDPLSFCGDALFACGCGRLFEGTPEQMRDSLAKLRTLPEDTLVCCGHEYTLANVAFARAVCPDESVLRDFEIQCRNQRDAGQPTLPTRMAQELRLNPFLRWDDENVAEAAAQHGRRAGLSVDRTNADQVFAALRHWKDHF